MKQIISGRLAAQPELKEITLKDGTQQQVTNFTIFAYDPAAPEKTRADGSAYRKGIPLRCVAWGEQAQAVAKMKKGQTLTASTTMRFSEYPGVDGSPITQPKYVIKRIDPKNEIQKQISELLAGYEEGLFQQVYQKSDQPHFQTVEESKDEDKELAPEQEREREAEESEQEEERFRKDFTQQSHNGEVETRHEPQK